MPFDYRIDKKRRLVLSTCSGIFTIQDAEHHRHQLTHDPDFDATFYQLADFTAVTKVAITADQFREFAQARLFLETSRRAFVTPRPGLFGVARMFQAYREGSGVGEQLQVFADLSTALQWLGR